MATHRVQLPEGSAARQIEQHLYNKDVLWKQIFAELIDNSLDAKATTIEFVQHDGVLEVSDDGHGCADPRDMVSLGTTKIHPGTTSRAGRFGFGCKVACIRACQGQQVTIISTHNGMEHRLTADWEAMIEQDAFFADAEDSVPTTNPSGVILIIHNCKELPRGQKLQKLIAELGWLYMDAIKAGKQIKLLVGNEQQTINAYAVPPHEKREKFQFEWQGHTIKGFCVLVKKGMKNEHPGWSIHWGPHRILGCFEDPAYGSNTSRLQGHVYIPEAYKGVNVTKDGFSDPPDDLYELINEKCAEIIEKADADSHTHDIEQFNEKVAEKLNEALPKASKGSRPGSAGKNGTVIPTDNGTPHKHFAKRQPGDRAPDPEIAARMPDQFQLAWDDQLEDPWRVQATAGKPGTDDGKHKHRKQFATIYLSKRYPKIRYLLEKKDVGATVVFCHAIMAHYYNINPSRQKWTKEYEEMRLADWFQILAGKPDPIEALTEAPANA